MYGLKILFDYPGEDNEDIQRCIQNLFLTPVGTAPLDRDFGIDNAFVDQPPLIAKNKLAVEVVEKVERYEPRVTVNKVICDLTTHGKLDVEVHLHHV